MILEQSTCHQLIRIIDEIILLKEQHFLGFEVAINIKLMELLLLLCTEFQDKRTPCTVALPSIITDTLVYIDEHLDEDLSLKKLSSTLYLSGTHISRTFKHFMGITIQDYIINKRIEYAKKLLLQGHSVDFVAASSGFRTYSHFIRTFKKNSGISPGKYKSHEEYTI